MQITTHSRNLLNVVAHESVPNRQRWTYRHDGKWHVTDERPVITRNDYVVVNVKEVYGDAESMLKAERSEGFHSWQASAIRKLSPVKR